ncbi:MAG: AAA family ATPase [Lachnospiraceae bacterium]
MKIAVMGYSGSGKSTLCRKLHERYPVPVLHLDTVQFLPGWEVREKEAQQDIVQSFLDGNPGGWIIDGNYSNLCYARRIAEADLVVLLLFGRWNCLLRCARRYRIYRGKSRPDMTKDCNEKLDWEFIRWILWEGRTKKIRDRYRLVQAQYPDKVIVLRNQRQLDAFIRRLDLS